MTVVITDGSYGSLARQTLYPTAPLGRQTSMASWLLSETFTHSY